MTTPPNPGSIKAADREATILKWEWASLATIIVLAIVVRIIGLDTSLWYDEIFTVVEFVRLPTPELLTTFSSLNNHMFYSLQAQAAIALLGESAWVVRLPAVVFGVASLVLIWLIARQVAGRTTALLTVFLLAISYHHVWFSQNARGYTGLLFWTSAATLLLAEGLKRPAWRVWVAYALVVAAAMYTHLSAGFFFAAHGVVYLGAQAVARLRKERPLPPGMTSWLPLAGVGLAVLITLALHAPLMAQVATTIGDVSQASGAETGALAEWRNPLRALAEVSASVPALGVFAPIALLGAFGLIVIGAVSLCRTSPMLSSVYVVHIPLAIVLLTALSFRIWPRYFVVDIGFIYLCVVHGVVVASGWMTALLRADKRLPPARATLIAIAAVIMTAGSLLLLTRNYQHPKQDFTGAKSFVESHRGPRDAVATVGLARFVYGRYYAPSWKPVGSETDLARLRRQAPVLWVVVAFPYQARSSDPAVMARLDADYDRLTVFPGTLGDGDVQVYRSRR